LNIGLNGQYAVWVGTLLDINQPLVLITEEGNEQEAVLRLARVGYENVVGYLKGSVGGWDGKLDTVETITPERMKAELAKGIEVLDVRKPGEWAVSHLKDANFLPLADILNNTGNLSKSNPYLVHCAGGYRSMIAISMLKRLGFTGRLVNIQGGFGAMLTAGLPTVTEEVVA
jgi:rhodanese-related sulfurtransferase